MLAGRRRVALDGGLPGPPDSSGARLPADAAVAIEPVVEV